MTGRFHGSRWIRARKVIEYALNRENISWGYWRNTIACYKDLPTGLRHWIRQQLGKDVPADFEENVTNGIEDVTSAINRFERDDLP